MVTVHISQQVGEKCWNLYDSYGEICVHCGCCSDDLETRYSARLRCIEVWLKEKKNFDLWADDPEIRKMQRRNLMVTIDRLKRKQQYYRRKLMEVANGEGKVST